MKMVRRISLGSIALVLLVAISASGLDTGWQNPSQDSGEFGSPTNAYQDGGGAATAAFLETHLYSGYGFSLPAAAAIDGIQVRLDTWYAHALGGTEPVHLQVTLSWDGGTSWTSVNSTSNLSKTENTYILGGANHTWGRASWTPSELSNANFRVKVEVSSTAAEVTVNLDWIPVRVYYTPLSVTVTDNLADPAISQSDLASWFNDPAAMERPVGSFTVMVTGTDYQVDVCYEVGPAPSPAFTSDPIKIENPQGSGTWNFVSECPTEIELLGFSGTSGESNTYPAEVDLHSLGDRESGDLFSFTIKVSVSPSS